MMRNVIYIFLLFIALVGYSIKGDTQIITAAEYFINIDPGVGNGTAINGATGPITVNAIFEVPQGKFHTGFNELFVRVKDQNNSWSIAEQRNFYVDNTLSATTPLLTAAEYFIDSDPGAGNASPFNIQSADSVSNLINIPTNLRGGFHQLFIRLKDQNNIWSIAEQRTFYVDDTFSATTPSLTAAEYFIDKDPGVGNGVPIPVQSGDAVNILINIPTNLTGGFHQLFIRAKDQNNNWSIADQRTFHIYTAFNFSNDSLSIGLNPLVAAEYFINTDSGVGKNTPVLIIKGDSVNGSYIYNAPDLAPGNYTMNLRVEDSAGNWSIVESRPFKVEESPVPVTLMNFLLNCDAGKVLLTWQTATEINSNNFEIQKSSDGLYWNTIGLLHAAGNSNSIRNYQFTDEDAAGISLYRLRQVDKDGKSAYSAILKSSCTSPGVKLEIYPIPTKNEMNVLIQAANNCNTNILLTDTYGNIIMKMNKSLLKGTNTILLNVSNISSGAYFLKVEGIEGLGTRKIVISR